MKITIKKLKQLIKEAINEPVVGNPHKSLSPEKMDQIDQKHDEPGRKAYYRDGINQKAMSYAKDAIALNPNNPGLKITLASVFWTDDKISEAKDYANQGLALKSDYIDALLLLSQIAKKEGDNVLAISYAERALALAPTNPDLIKYMDSFKTAPVISTSAPDTENP